MEAWCHVRLRPGAKCLKFDGFVFDLRYHWQCNLPLENGLSVLHNASERSPFRVTAFRDEQVHARGSVQATVFT